MKIFHAIAAGAVFALAPIKPAPAAATQSAERSTTVAIPFNPPVGKELQYRLSRSENRSGKEKATEVRLVVRFEPISGGSYRLHSRMIAPSDEAINPTQKEILELATVFRVDDEGAIVGIEDEETYWKMIERALNDMVAADPKATPQDRLLMKQIYGQMRQLPDEQRVALMAKNIQPLLEMVGGEFSLGETLEGEDEAAMPLASLADVKLARKLLITANSKEPGTVTVSVQTRTDPEALKRVVERMAAMGPKGKPVEVPDLDIRQESSYQVSLETGLTLRYSETIESGDGKEKRHRVTNLELVH